ncbi:MAG: CBS domain-containing protein [Alphaproteobacteria bacterium]|nr:CBS domain-containing protein [Alphaproteobacteria bacterium]
MLRHVSPDVVINQDLLTMPETASVKEAAIAMKERGVHSVLVVEGDALLGIFTGADLIDRVVANGRDPDATKVGHVMTSGVETVPPDTLAIDALRKMSDGGFRHLPVVKDGRLVAVLSRQDFLREEEDEMDLEQALWEHL